MRKRLRVAAMAAALAVVAGACGGDETDTTSQTGSTTSAGRESVAVQADGAAGSAFVSDAAPGGRQLPPGIEELAFAFGDSTTTPPTSVTTETTAGTDDSAAPAVGTTPTTTGSGGAPVTTVGAGPRSDPAGIYRGELGLLGANDVVTAAVAAPPATQVGVQPLTGLAGSVPTRPAAVVKIDNSSRARPQSGIDVADVVVEEEVEGGITRLAAIFHSTNAIVGPVRSGRTTDIGVLMSLGSPLLMYSGANDVTDALLLDRSNVQNRSAARSSGYWRQSGRRAPSNLYTDTAPHWASASRASPAPMFAYRSSGVGSDGDPVSSFTVAYRASRAAWQWDGAAWLRSQGGSPHVAASGARIAAANVVVIETRKVDTGMVDSSGAQVPEFVFVGSGRATVFTDGKRIVGTWTKPTLSSVATLTRADGSVIELTPGQTWVELIEAGAGLLQ